MQANNNNVTKLRKLPCSRIQRFRENLTFHDYFSKKGMHEVRRNYGNGIFKCVPQPFYQIFTIRIDRHYHTNTTTDAPSSYALLPNKAYT